MFNQYTPLRERFDASYVIEANSGCWLWTGACVSSKSGDVRPRINVEGRPRTAYRVGYELHIGKIPDGKMLCHKCNVSICVNPDHVYPGTARDNALDAVAAGHNPAQRNPARAIAWARELGQRPKPRVAMPERGKIVQSDLSAIRKELEQGGQLRAIAKRYGATGQALYQLLKRDTIRAALSQAGGASE